VDEIQKDTSLSGTRLTYEKKASRAGCTFKTGLAVPLDRDAVAYWDASVYVETACLFKGEVTEPLDISCVSWRSHVIMTASAQGAEESISVGRSAVFYEAASDIEKRAQRLLAILGSAVELTAKECCCFTEGPTVWRGIETVNSEEPRKVDKKAVRGGDSSVFDPCRRDVPLEDTENALLVVRHHLDNLGPGATVVERSASVIERSKRSRCVVGNGKYRRAASRIRRCIAPRPLDELLKNGCERGA
jgi:hypothetical protein